VDILGRELGWQVEAPKINITRVSAHVVNEEPIAFIQEAGSKNWWTRNTPLPKNIQLFDNFATVDLSKFKAVLWVTNQDIPDALWQQLHESLVVYRVPA
jgi:cobalt-precorrin 5A hydrolase